MRAVVTAGIIGLPDWKQHIMILAAYEGGGSIVKNLTNVVCFGLNTWSVWQLYMVV